jgi:hypothetical protein
VTVVRRADVSEEHIAIIFGYLLTRATRRRIPQDKIQSCCRCEELWQANHLIDLNEPSAVLALPKIKRMPGGGEDSLTLLRANATQQYFCEVFRKRVLKTAFGSEAIV